MSKYKTPNIKEGFAGSNQQVLFPRLVCKINLYQDQIILSQDGREFSLHIDAQSGKALQQIFAMMDGTRSISELQQICAPHNPEVINTLVRDLDEQKLLDDAAPLTIHSGIDTLLELEELAHKLLNQRFKKNCLWKLIDSTVPVPPIQVLYGFAIEHYHFFGQKSCFHSPVLGFPSSTKVRQLLDELYLQAYGQERLLMEALNAISICHQELADTMALPETMAMCNGLAFWATFDPVFYLSTLGVLVDNTFKTFQMYLTACERLELDPGFIEPVRQLVNTKLKNQESASRRIFPEIPHIDRETSQRFREQTYLFIEMYNNFYAAIGRHYSSAPDLLRRVSLI